MNSLVRQGGGGSQPPPPLSTPWLAPPTSHPLAVCNMQHDTWHKAGTGRTHIRPFATEIASTEKLSNQLLLHDEPNATIPKALLESIVFVS